MRNAIPVLAVLMSAACGEGIPGGTNPDPTDPNQNPEQQQQLDGMWQLQSQVGVPPTVILPEQAYESVEALRGLSTNPAKTLFDLADAAGVSEVGTVQSLVPDLVESKLYDWMNELILARLVAATPVPAQISLLADQIASPLTSFELATELTIDPSATSSYPAKHVLKAVVLTPLNAEKISVPPIASTVIGTDTLTVTANGTNVTLSEHAFGLPLGEYAIRGADMLTARQFGGRDLRGALGLLIGCDQVMQQLADKCIGFACVGHQAELQTICEKGLDASVAQVHQRLREQDINAVHFESGAAKLEPKSLAQGQWDAALNIGLGERPTTATFSGVR